MSALGPPERSSLIPALRYVTRTLGGLILLSVAWQVVGLLFALGHHWASLSCWLHILAALPIVVLCMTGAIAVLQANPSGYFPLYLGAFAALLPWGFPLLPFIADWLGRRLAHGSPLRPFNEVQFVNL